VQFITSREYAHTWQVHEIFVFPKQKKKNLVSPTDAVQEPIAEQETWIFTGDLILFMQR
jgi:hypothetical protein